MNIFDIFAAAKFEYAVYSNLAATPPLSRIIIILLDKLTDSKPKIVDSIELAIFPWQAPLIPTMPPLLGLQ